MEECFDTVAQIVKTYVASEGGQKVLDLLSLLLSS